MSWLTGAENPTAEKLVTIIQDRIRRDASDYDVFMDMLRDTDGMDQIAEKLQLPSKTTLKLLLIAGTNFSEFSGNQQKR